MDLRRGDGTVPLLTGYGRNAKFISAKVLRKEGRLPIVVGCHDRRGNPKLKEMDIPVSQI